jgi:carboxymethylenebutenolidase
LARLGAFLLGGKSRSKQWRPSYHHGIKRKLEMNDLTPKQQAMLTAWREHTYAEFALKDADAALATMSEDPSVLLVASATWASGRAGVREFYAKSFLPSIPPDFELVSLSQTFGSDRIVEEFVVRFTHTLPTDWMLPGVPATGRPVEFGLIGVVQFHAGKVAAERLYWDQATVLTQLGLTGHPVAAAGVGSAARLLQLAAGQIGDRGDNH